MQPFLRNKSMQWSNRFHSSLMREGLFLNNGDENLREKIFENYRIVYRLKKDVVEIVAICHGAQPLRNIL